MSAAPKSRNAIALVAGIGVYRHRDRIPPLRFAPRDARSMERVLIDPEVCGFPRERVVTLTNRQANRASLVRHLSRWLPEQGKGVDLALVYFAGHGVVRRVGGREEGYLLPHDADPDDVVTHGIAMSDLTKWIEDVGARAIVVCLDCCHAGAIVAPEGLSMRGEERNLKLQASPTVLQQLSGRHRYLIASCDREQESLEPEELKHGLFTYHLLKGLLGEGDRDNDGRVSVAELFSYVSAAVTCDAWERFHHLQTPWTSATYTEDVCLSTVRPRRQHSRPGTGTSAPEVPPPSKEDTELVDRLRALRRRPNSAELAFLLGCLAHKSEAVRSQANRALKALGWDQASRAAEQLARAGDGEAVGAVLEGLAALEARAEVVSLLDRLAGLLQGPPRDRALWLLDRKRLALERERLGEVFVKKHCRYDIEKVLGPGLYTGAYLARQHVTGLEVVLRVLRREFASHPLVKSSFITLGNGAVRMIHPNLALTRDVLVYEDADLYFTVRDYVDGPTLREVLEKGRRFEPLAVIKLLRQLLDVLARLHAEEQVHGGIKPSNIFLTRNDQVVLGDRSLPLLQSVLGFDLARLVYDFRYVAPELFRAGGRPSPASDVYSLGCVAYELFHGRPPFVADSTFELFASHDRDPVALTPGNAIDDWLAGLLAKPPTERPGVAALVAGLQEVEESLRPRPPRPPRPPDEPLPDIQEEPVPRLSVHLLREQSLVEYEGRESIVPGTVPPTGVVSGDYSVASIGQSSPGIRGYEILSEIGRGGMGVVYKARQLLPKRIVALKMILVGRHASEQDIMRFQVEAEAVASILHPGIVQIFEVDTYEGLPYFAMEFCPGGSLAQRLSGKPLPAREAAQLLEQIGRSLQAAHAKAIVHRDLKPANILFTEDGQPKVVDFGLAKRLDEVGLTQSGALLGTPSYMAPEQTGGQKDVGPAADIYALGAMLYECLTGRPPFHGPSMLEILEQVRVAEPIAPSRLVPGVPSDLETICLKCLEKSPTRRYASAGDLADDLGRFLDSRPIKARPVGRLERAWKWARRRPTEAALALVSLLAVTSLIALLVVLWLSRV
jgi:serine/threonine protein kinase